MLPRLTTAHVDMIMNWSVKLDLLVCWYFAKNDLRHSGRTGIISIAVRGLALVPKD